MATPRTQYKEPAPGSSSILRRGKQTPISQKKVRFTENHKKKKKQKYTQTEHTKRQESTRRQRQKKYTEESDDSDCEQESTKQRRQKKYTEESDDSDYKQESTKQRQQKKHTEESDDSDYEQESTKQRQCTEESDDSNYELDENEFEVEAILAHRTTKGAEGSAAPDVEYLIKWKGFPDSENTWTSSTNMDCWRLLQDYLKMGFKAIEDSQEPPRDDGELQEPPRNDGESREPPRDDGESQEPPRNDGESQEPSRRLRQPSRKSRQPSRGSRQPSRKTTKKGTRRRGIVNETIVLPHQVPLPSNTVSVVTTEEPLPVPRTTELACTPTTSDQPPLPSVDPVTEVVYISDSDESPLTSPGVSRMLPSPIKSPLNSCLSLIQRDQCSSPIRGGSVPSPTTHCDIISPLHESDFGSQNSLESLSGTESLCASPNDSFHLSLDSSVDSASSWSIESLMDSPSSSRSSLVAIDPPRTPSPPPLRLNGQKGNHTGGIPHRKNGIVSQSSSSDCLHPTKPPHSGVSIKLNGFTFPLSSPLTKPLSQKETQLIRRELSCLSTNGNKSSKRSLRHTMDVGDLALIAGVVHSAGQANKKPARRLRRNGHADEWSLSRLRKRGRSASPPSTPKPDKRRCSPRLSRTHLAPLSTKELQQHNSCIPPSQSINCKKSSEKYQQQLVEWQFQINKQRRGLEEIVFVENDIDQAPIPKNFTYITSNIYRNGVPDPSCSENSGSLCGCTCYYMGKKCGPRAGHCCPQMAGAVFPYTVAGKVRVAPGKPIFECNVNCCCPPDCANRVVQHGRLIPLAIFRTHDGRGWGVKTTDPIKANTFVAEYVGEVITTEEAERRGKLYDQQGETYLFDLDFNDEDPVFTIDAAKYGNITHFFNHSCDPNLVVYSVWIDTLDQRLPRIAFFTTRNVSANEELTFDYQMNYKGGSSTPKKSPKGRVQCLCGASDCIGYLC